MSTNPVRVPQEVHEEVHAAARLLGCKAADLLERAWEIYRQSPEFLNDLQHAQKALSVGDLGAVVDRLRERSLERASRRAHAVHALRRPAPNT